MGKSENSIERNSYSKDYYEDEINLKDLINVLWKWWKLILAIFLVVLSIGAIYSFTATPVYQAQVKISLGNYLERNISGPIVSPEEAKEILTNGSLKDESGEHLPQVQGLAVSPITDTKFIRVTCKSGDPNEATAQLDTLAQFFTEQINEDFEQQQELMRLELQRVGADLVEVEETIKLNRKLMESLSEAESSGGVDLQQIRLLDALASFSAQREGLLDKKLQLEQELKTNQGAEVIGSATASSVPVSPRKKVNIAVSGALGLMLGVFAAFTVDYFRRNPLSTDND